MSTNIPWYPEQFYHIFNRGHNHDKLFFEDKNYKFFMNKISGYLVDYMNILAYVLIPNHFHIIVKIKSRKEILDVYKQKYPGRLGEDPHLRGFKNQTLHLRGFQNQTLHLRDFKNQTLHLRGFKNLEGVDLSDIINKIISQPLSNMFNSYTKSINKQEGRSGSLFTGKCQRKLIDSDEYLSSVIAYTHYNPLKHNISENISEYKWSSYNSILTNQETKINREIVLDIFDGRKSFVEFHENYVNFMSFKNIEEFWIE